MAPIATGDDRIGVKSDILNVRSPMNNVNIATVYVMQSSKDASFIARAGAEFWSTWLQILTRLLLSLSSQSVGAMIWWHNIPLMDSPSHKNDLIEAQCGLPNPSYFHDGWWHITWLNCTSFTSKELDREDPRHAG